MRRAAIAIAAALVGCQAQGLIASPSDYASYRATRVGPTFEDRLAAAQRYLEEHPDGRYREEVRAFFLQAEDAFYTTKKGSREGLVAYLSVLPKGPHHDAATKRVAQIDAAEQARIAALERSTAVVRARVSGRQAEDRARVQEELKAWLARWIDRAAFEAPVSRASAALVVPFALSLPSPRCALVEPPAGPTARRCTKLLELGYDVEIDVGTEPRQLTLEITAHEDARGVPREVTIAGPDLFSRLEETYRVKPIDRGDTAARAAAVTRATGLVKAAFAHAVSDDEACRLKPAAPAVLDLGCDGLRVTVSAGGAQGEDDRVVIRSTR